MSRKKTSKTRRIDNSLSELVAAVRVAGLGTGGSTLSSYGTIARANNYSLITLNRIILTYLYTGNGIFQTAIQIPVQDAISKGVELESDEMDVADIDRLTDYWEEIGLWDTVLNFYSWVRLFGGGGIIINSNQDPEKPLSMRELQNSPMAFYDADRWQIETGNPFNMGMEGAIEHVYETGDFYNIQGIRIHRSRVLTAAGKRAPSYVRRQLRGWGVSEGERMIRDLNNYLKTNDVLYEILDESKVDVYHIAGLANKLLTAGGTDTITRRIQAANEIKNYVNALVLDGEEEYEQKQVSFAGLAQVMRENRIGVASAVRIPVTKLFGLSATGFNTGEIDLESYNQMVESDVRTKLRPVIRKLFEVTMGHLFGRVPSFRFSWPTLRVLSAADEENVKTAKASRTLMYYDRGLMDSEEAMQQAAKDKTIDIKTKAEQGLVPNPKAPNEGANVSDTSGTASVADASGTEADGGGVAKMANSTDADST